MGRGSGTVNKHAEAYLAWLEEHADDEVAALDPDSGDAHYMGFDALDSPDDEYWQAVQGDPS